jgi:probable HAF family extracellular repeat protein
MPPVAARVLHRIMEELMRPRRCRWIVVSLLIAIPASHGRCQSFHALGFLPGADIAFADAVTADGSTVFGASGLDNSLATLTPIRWSIQSGIESLAMMQEGQRARIWDVSSDSETIVGQLSTGEIAFGIQAFRWTPEEGIVPLGDLPGGRVRSFGYGVSDGGQAAVGLATVADGLGGDKSQAFRWTPGEGMRGLGFLPDKTDQSVAHAISGDGSVVVGLASRIEMTGDYQMRYHEAFRWTEETGMIGLGDLPGGEYGSTAEAISSDGKVIVGRSGGENGGEAFRWTEESGMVGLGILPSDSGFTPFSGANAVSADGSVIVGTSTWEAVVWDQVHGLRSISGILTESGVDLSGWRLQQAVDVSADGRTILGYGAIGDGPEQPWVATLPASAFVPEPPTSQLFALGIPVVLLMGQIRNRRTRELACPNTESSWVCSSCACPHRPRRR